MNVNPNINKLLLHPPLTSLTPIKRKFVRERYRQIRWFIYFPIKNILIIILGSYFNYVTLNLYSKRKSSVCLRYSFYPTTHICRTWKSLYDPKNVICCNRSFEGWRGKSREGIGTGSTVPFREHIQRNIDGWIVCGKK